MIARRRLKRPIKRNTGLPPVHTHRVSLADAVIEKAGPGKAEREVEQMRQELAKEEQDRRQQAAGSKGKDAEPLSPITLRAGLSMNVPVEISSPREEDEDDSTESEGEEREGVKVAGEPSVPLIHAKTIG